MQNENNQAEHLSRLDNYQELNQRQFVMLLMSIMVVALCGITYELIIGTTSTYLIGNSVYQFSLTIGFFMFAMGIGSYLSKWVLKHLLENFVLVEIVVALIGGLCSITLFLTYSAFNAFYNPVMYTFIIVIGALVGLEIPLLTRILSQKEMIRKSIANVLSLDYVGALIGSVAFPLLLLPQLGLIRATFVIGLINILTAILNIHYFKEHLARPRLMRALAYGTLVILLALTVYGSWLTRYAEHHLYMDQVISEVQTPYQRIVFTQNNDSHNYRMYIDGHIQFSQRDEHRYHESLVHPVMGLPGPRYEILILGGGDGLAAREILKYPEVELIHLVDIDPAMTKFSSEFPAMVKMNAGSLSNPKLTVYNVDAFNFVNQPGIHYDRIIIDMPDPHSEVLSKLYSREFYVMIKQRLNPHGYLVTQSSSPFFTRRTYWTIAHTLQAAGLNTASYHVDVPSFGVWGFHLAAMNAIDTQQFKLDVPTRYLTPATFAATTVFASDMLPVTTPTVNTLLEPKLYTLYREDLLDNAAQ